MSESAVQPKTTAESVVTPGGAQLVPLYQANGTPLYVAAENADALVASLGLLRQRYDVPAAFATWLAAHGAVAPAVTRLAEETARLGYQREETVSVVNAAHGQMVDAFRDLTLALGGEVPTEQQIADLAEYVTTASLDDLPNQKHRAAAIAAYQSAAGGTKGAP